MLHISIKAEEVTTIFGFPLTNSLLSAFVVIIFFFLLAILFRNQFYKKRNLFTFFILFIIQGLYSLFKPILKDHTDKFFPLLASFFLFILIANWFGLIPGVNSILIKHETQAASNHKVAEETKSEVEVVPILRGATADLNMTVALALVSVALIQFFGVKYLGFKGYIKKFINLSSPLAFFTGVLEIVSEFSKIISFAFRLFGNIFAGEVLLAVIAFLIPILASFPFLLLEIFVGFIQALVFSMLTAAFLNMAISEHH